MYMWSVAMLSFIRCHARHTPKYEHHHHLHAAKDAKTFVTVIHFGSGLALG